MTARTQKTDGARQGMAELVTQLVGDFSHLVAQHVALAKLELQKSARTVGLSVGQIAAFAPLILVGYAFLNAGLALALARWLPLPGALALVGLVNVLGGMAGIAGAARRLRRPVLETSRRELEQTAHALTPERISAPALEARHGH
jgi:uncharacterized membrane protein YqjE